MKSSWPKYPFSVASTCTTNGTPATTSAATATGEPKRRAPCAGPRCRGAASSWSPDTTLGTALLVTSGRSDLSLHREGWSYGTRPGERETYERTGPLEGVVRAVVPEPARHPAQPQPQQHLDEHVPGEPRQLGQHAQPVRRLRTGQLEPGQRAAAVDVDVPGAEQDLRDRAQRDADRGEAVVHEDLPTRRQVPRPAQVVGVGPVVVLAVDVEQVERAGPARAELGRVGAHELHHVGEPGVRDVRLEAVPGRRAAEQPAVDERVDGDHPGAHRTRRLAEDDRGSALVTAYLEHGRPRLQPEHGLPQQPGLSLGQPARYVGDRLPDVVEVHGHLPTRKP